MGDKSKIEWTDATWNPIRGCSVISEGCRNCYAMQVAARFNKNGQAYEGLAYRNDAGAHWTGKVRFVEEHLTDPLRWRRPALVFVNSMSDLFHEELGFAQIFHVFLIMQQAPQHTFQVLTKRPARMKEFIEWMQIWGEATALAMGIPEYFEWPYPNTWLGVSVEDQKTADERIPLLLQTPAAVRWISAEPLLGPIKTRAWYCACGWKGSESTLLPSPSSSLVCPQCGGSGGLLYRNWLISDEGRRPALDWVVVGGESGPRARPMHPDWARSLRDQCVAAGVPFFFKQWGEWVPTADVGLGDMPHAKTHVFDTGKFVETYGGPVPFGIEVRRIGKKAAGRLLDGLEWNAFPTSEAGA